jgi:cytochrome c peroxidase
LPAKFLYIWILVLILSACNKEDLSLGEKITAIPVGFPPILEPIDNEYSHARWLLGKKLFYDPILSRDSTISCASCHKIGLAFADMEIVSPGVDQLIGKRNSPSLANVAYHPYFMREGGVNTLEAQVLVPLQEHTEMDFNIVAAGERLNTIEAYNKMSLLSYNREMDYYVVTRALACFERTLISGDSPYDQYHFQNKNSALSEMEIRGMNLFFSNRTNCGNCHGDFNFTNYAFENNGLYAVYEDQGRFILTSEETDREKFKVPSLRNVGLTAPYMHDGSMSNLEAVIEHYNIGGQVNLNKSPLITPLNLNGNEKEDLIAFLHALTDTKFINNKLLKP